MAPQSGRTTHSVAAPTGNGSGLTARPSRRPVRWARDSKRDPSGHLRLPADAPCGGATTVPDHVRRTTTATTTPPIASPRSPPTTGSGATRRRCPRSAGARDRRRRRRCRSPGAGAGLASRSSPASSAPRSCPASSPSPATCRVDAEPSIERVKRHADRPAADARRRRDRGRRCGQVARRSCGSRVTRRRRVGGSGIVVRDDGTCSPAPTWSTGASAITVVLADGRGRGELVGRRPAHRRRRGHASRRRAHRLRCSAAADDLDAGAAPSWPSAPPRRRAGGATGVISALGAAARRRRRDAPRARSRPTRRSSRVVRRSARRRHGAVIGITTDLAATGTRLRLRHADRAGPPRRRRAHRRRQGRPTSGSASRAPTSATDERRDRSAVGSSPRVMAGSPADRAGLRAAT